MFSYFYLECYCELHGPEVWENQQHSASLSFVAQIWEASTEQLESTSSRQVSSDPPALQVRIVLVIHKLEMQIVTSQFLSTEMSLLRTFVILDIYLTMSITFYESIILNSKDWSNIAEVSNSQGYFTA